MKLSTQYYFVYIIVLKCLELKNIVMCLQLRVKLRFKHFKVVLAFTRLR